MLNILELFILIRNHCYVIEIHVIGKTIHQFRFLSFYVPPKCLLAEKTFIEKSYIFIGVRK